MKNGKIAAKLLTVVAGCMLLAVVVEVLASTPLFMNRINLRTWHRSNIPLAIGPNPVVGAFPAGRFPFGLSEFGALFRVAKQGCLGHSVIAR